MTTDHNERPTSSSCEPFSDLEIEQLREITGPVLVSDAERLAILSRFDQLRSDLEQHELANRLNESAFTLLQTRCMVMAEALDSITRLAKPEIVSTDVILRTIGKRAEKALEGIPALPERSEPISPTVQIAMLRHQVLRLAEAVQHSRPDHAGALARELQREVRHG